MPRKRKPSPFKIDRDPGPPLTVDETGRKYGLTDKQIADVKAFCAKYGLSKREISSACKVLAAFDPHVKGDAA